MIGVRITNREVDSFMALTIASVCYSASYVKTIKCAAAYKWLNRGNKGAYVDMKLWKKFYKGPIVLKGGKIKTKSRSYPTKF